MALPGADRLLSLPTDRWRAFGERLESIGIAAAYDRIAALGPLFPTLSLPLRRWHLQRMGGPAAHAARLFAVQDAIGAAEAREALGDLVDDLGSAGLLLPVEGGRVRSALALGMFGGAPYFSDDLGAGADAVMGPAHLTADLLRASGALDEDRPPPASALELGCGAAAASIVLARRGARVVATDVNARAATLATVNAAINGAGRVEVRAGDLYAPVAGERFDLVICQPPFFPKPEEAGEAVFAYGGRRGDEMARRMIGGVFPHLAERGRAFFVMQWPVFAGEPPVAEVVRVLVPEDAGVLVLETDGPDLDTYALGDASHEHPDLGAEFQRQVTLRREHLDRLGVERLLGVIAVIERAPRPYTASFRVDDLAVSRLAVEGLAAGAELLSRGREGLLAARLCAARGAAFAAGKDEVRVLFPGGAARREAKLNPGAYRVVTLVDGAPTVQAAVNRFRREGNYRPADALERMLPAVDQLLRAGVLEVAR